MSVSPLSLFGYSPQRDGIALLKKGEKSHSNRGWDSGQDGAGDALKVFVGREETKPLTEE